MPQPKRLVCFIEGQGDKTAIPTLARRVLKEISATDVLVVDSDERGPYHVQNLGKLLKTEPGKRLPNWQRWLQAAAYERQPLGGVLLALDGDESKPMSFWEAYCARFGTDRFCARDAARLLALDARGARAGEAFSAAVAFVVKEFETWLLAGVESLRGKHLSDGHTIIPMMATCPDRADFEARRDAKRELRRIIPSYNPADDQGVLAKHVDLETVAAKCPSFRRFQRAIREIADAVRSGHHVSTPAMSS